MKDAVTVETKIAHSIKLLEIEKSNYSWQDMQKLSKMAYSAILAILILPQKYLKLRRGHSCVRCITNIHVGLKKSLSIQIKKFTGVPFATR